MKSPKPATNALGTSWSVLWNVMGAELNFSLANMPLIMLTRFELHLLCKKPEVFMIPGTFQKLNLLLIFTFYIISRVSIFNFQLTWLVFRIF